MSSVLEDLFSVSLSCEHFDTIQNLISATGEGIETGQEFQRSEIEDHEDCGFEVIKQKSEISIKAIKFSVSGVDGCIEYKITAIIQREGTARQSLEQNAQSEVIPMLEVFSSLTKMTQYATIQRCFRSFLARKQLRIRKQRHHNQVKQLEKRHHIATCSTQIQKLVRGHLARNKYQKLRQEQITVATEEAIQSASQILFQIKSGQGSVKDFEEIIKYQYKEFFSCPYSDEGGFELSIVEYYISRGWDTSIPNLIKLLKSGIEGKYCSDLNPCQKDISIEFIQTLNKYILHAAEIGRQSVIGILCAIVKEEIYIMNSSKSPRKGTSRDQSDMFQRRPDDLVRTVIEIPHPRCQFHWSYCSDDDPLLMIKKKDILLLLVGIYGRSILMQRDDGGGTAVHCALVGGFEDLFDFLIGKMSLNPNELDHSSRTPLHHAAAFGTADRVIETCVKFANVLQVNAFDSNHNTPLHYAARRSQCPDFEMRLVKALLRMGATPTKQNNNSFTSIDISKICSNTQLTNVLLYYEPFRNQPQQPMDIPSSLFGSRTVGKLKSAVIHNREAEERIGRVVKSKDIKLNEGGFAANKKINLTYREMVEMLCKKNKIIIPKILISENAVVPNVNCPLSQVRIVSIEDGYLGMKHLLVVSSVIVRCHSVTCLSLKHLALRPQHLSRLLSSLISSSISEINLIGNDIKSPAVTPLVSLAVANLSKLSIDNNHAIPLTSLKQIEEVLLSRGGFLFIKSD